MSISALTTLRILPVSRPVNKEGTDKKEGLLCQFLFFMKMRMEADVLFQKRNVIG